MNDQHPSRNSSNVIATYDTPEGHAEIHGTAGGFTVFVGGRLVQKDLGAREFACYVAHVLQSAHYRLAKAAPSETVLADRKAIGDAVIAFQNKKKYLHHPNVRPFNGTANGDSIEAWESDYAIALGDAVLAIHRQEAKEPK